MTILTALAAEANALASPGKSFKSTKISGVKEELIGNCTAAFVQCGIGQETLYRKAIQLLNESDIVGNVGVCGGLEQNLKPGMVLIVDRIVTSPISKYAESESYIPDQAITGMLESIMQENSISYKRGTLLCSDDVLSTKTEKLAAFHETLALAVDMESAGAAKVARQAKLPFFCIKVICDTAEMEIAEELLKAVDSQGNSRPSRLIFPLVMRPWLAVQIWQMAKNFSQAIRAIRRFWGKAQRPLADYAAMNSATRSFEGNHEST